MIENKEIARHTFAFNDKNNGGEQFIITTKVYDNDDSIYTNQELTLYSYENSASFNLSGAQITPQLLRELANQLDEFKAKLTK